MPVELENVSYTYAPSTPYEIEALSNVSLKINDGEFIGVMGHTGCGKSTMIQLIAGLLVPSEGKVTLDGSDINAKGYDRSTLRRDVGIVFQYPEYQLFETTVEKDVAFGLKHSGLDRGEMTERVKWALEIMGFSFDSIKNQSPLALSGGEKRRVAIAGVLAVRPKIVIFDEPIAGLDPLGREAFLKLISDINEKGTTIITVSHNTDSMAEYAKRIIVFDAGRLIMDGETREVFSDVKRMEELRLGVSQPRLIADMLSVRGIEMPRDIVSCDGLVSALKERLKGGERL